MAGTEVWDVWYPEAGAQGLPFARGRLDPTVVLLVHAAPQSLWVEVRDDAGALLARATSLLRTDDTPICRLTRDGATIRREDIWPAAADIGRPVLLAGGETGVLLSWWHADDRSAWRWRIELFNRR